MSFWLFAFLLHSTLWFSVAWLLTRSRKKMHPASRETVWYTAIVVSLVTPSVHVLGPGDLSSFWQLTLPGFLSPATDPGLLAGEHTVSPQPGESGFPWEATLLGIWFSTAGVLLVRYISRLVVLRRGLAREIVSRGSPEWIILRDLSRKAGLKRTPRLTESKDLGSPIAFGIGYLAEICVPTRAIHELDSGEFSAMLGHEIAHHQRRDPIRLSAMNVLRSLFFFQPLLRVAGRDVQWAAEEQCDALAATHTQDPVAVARCLTEVAGWVLPRNHHLPVAGMAGSRSHLVQRVDRLIDHDGRTGVRGRHWRRLGSLSVLVLAPWLAPGITPAAELPHADFNGVEGETEESRAEHRAGDGKAGEEHGGEESGHVEREHGEHGEH